MNSLTFILVVTVGVCQGATFRSDGDQKCWYPSWKCHCKVVYDCDDMDGKFPVDLTADRTVAGEVKDLAPDTYPLEMPGKRWRRRESNQEDFCKKECRDRMNAFLCPESNGDLSDYSYSAVCLNLLKLATDDGTPVVSPFAQDGSDEPCCAIYLQYGRAWCTKKWYEEIGTARCLTNSAVDFSAITGPGVVTKVYSVDKGCVDDGTTDYPWCAAAPICDDGGTV